MKYGLTIVTGPSIRTGEVTPCGGTRSNGRTVSRRKLVGHDNLAIIRSGQDWSNTTDVKRDLFVGQMRPILQAGMDFLSTQGADIGCYSNRLMRNVDDSGNPLDQAFGLSYWRSLADLEAWAEHHPTHLAIFDGFMEIAQAPKGEFDLRLYHEVCVVASAEQHLEYIGCHDWTGMLATLSRG